MCAYDPTSMEATEFLKEEFFKRKNKNESYSIRAFSRDLGVSHALLSQIFSGKRTLSAKQAHKMSTLLGLSNRDSQRLLEASLQSKSSGSKETHQPYEDLQFEFEKVVGRWFHTALLELTYLKNFKDDPVWIGKKLGIPSIEVRDAISRLKKLGLLKEQDGSLFKTKNLIRFNGSRSIAAVRAYYTSILEKAVNELKDSSDAAFQSRYIGGGTLAIQLEKLPQARKRLKEMQDDFIQEFACKNADRVYQFNLNFFSLTKKE